MKPWVLLERDGALTLRARDGSFLIQIDGRPLMHSERHGSEEALARVGCELVPVHGARVLVGGLGFGFTLRAALDVLAPQASVVVSEVAPAVVRWNRERPAVAALAGRPLDDPRVSVELGDVLHLVRRSPRGFDAILLDVDNGPFGLTGEASELYGAAGLAALRRALRPGGRFTLWSAGDDGRFMRRLSEAGFRGRLHSTRARAVLFVGDAQP